MLTAGYLREFARRPVNLALLIVVPVVFVTLAAGALAEFAEIVSSVADSDQIAAPTAGWAAAFLAGVAGFFHVVGSREADRRLSLAGMGPRRVMTARLVSGLSLAALAALTAVVSLALRTGIAAPGRAVAGTFMFAIIYLGIGAAVGALVKSEVNGSLVVIFIWMLDVFLGPAMAGSEVLISRLFPSHFVTLVMLDSASGHAGPLGDIGWALVWTLGALAFAAIMFVTSTKPAGSRISTSPGRWTRLGTGLRYALRDYRRNPAMWVLLAVLPVFFITLSFYVTPNDPTPVELVENGLASFQVISMIDVHGAIMVPITIGFLAGLAGLFVVQGSLEADARLSLAGFRTSEILISRLGIVALSALLTTAVSLGVTAADFTPQHWGWFVAGSLMVAAIYGLIGVLVGSVFGRLGGLYVMFLLPFIDIGIAQNIMFSAAPPGWGSFLPARGPVQVLVDGAFTSTFDQVTGLAIAIAWLVLLAVAAAAVFHRIARTETP